MTKCAKCNREIIVGIAPHKRHIELDTRVAPVYVPADVKYKEGISVLKVQDIYPHETFYVPHSCEDELFVDVDEEEE